MTKLSPAQAVALTEARERSDDYRNARARLQAELKVRLEAELDALRGQRDRAAFRAYQLGVPKRRIGLEALGTTDPKTPAEVVEAGRVLVGGTLDDPAALPELIAAATPEEPLYVHAGRTYADNHPFTPGDAPGTLTFHAYTGMAASNSDAPASVLVRSKDGHLAPVLPYEQFTEANHEAYRVLTAPLPFGRALQAAALAMLAN